MAKAGSGISADSGAKSCFFRHFWHHYMFSIVSLHTLLFYTKTSHSPSPHLSRLAQQIVNLLADIVDAGGDMGSQRKKNTDELLHHRRIAIHLHG